MLTNLSAGGRHRSAHAVLAEAGRHPEVIHRETRGSALAGEAIAEFADRDVDLLVVNGGDGTLQRALTEVLGQSPCWRPRIAPLRSGRTNMVALDLGASRDPAAALRALVHEAREGGLEARHQRRPVLRLEKQGEDAPHYGLFFGAGVICRAIDLTHRSFPKGRAQGVFGSSLVTAALLMRVLRGARDGVLQPDKVELRLDGRGEGAETYMLVIATTLHRLFLGLRPFWGEGPGRVRMTTLTAGCSGLGGSLPRLLRGLPPHRPTEGIESANVEEARLRLDCDISLDGELFGPRPDRLVRLTAPDTVDFLRA